MAATTLNYTGAAQSFTVPAGVTALDVEAVGAAGGNALTGGAGGRGGAARCTLSVTPGEVLWLYVGGEGQSSTAAVPDRTRMAGGWNGGGASGQSKGGAHKSGGGGGGASDVRRGGQALANRVVVAAGGGGDTPNVGGTVFYEGGNGGGDVGEVGRSADPSGTDSRGGGGGTQTAGGAGGTNSITPIEEHATAGTSGQGGQGSTSGSTTGSSSGGGGGGYFGGGGGGLATGTGGGGSNYFGAGTSSVTNNAQGTGPDGNGYIVLRYNLPPNAPGAFTSPTAGQVVDASVSAVWSGATDPDGDALTYALEVSRDNGATWSAVSTATTTSRAVDTSGIASSTAVLFRVRSVDPAGLTSAWTSSPVFTVEHNKAPTPPTLTAPTGGVSLDRTVTQRFSWTFADPDPGDVQSKRDLRYRLVGAPSWTVLTATTTATFLDLDGNTLVAGNYEWQVQTYDPQGAASGWSGVGYFTAATPPTGPSITAPANNATVGSTTLLQWSYPSQQAYQVQVLDAVDVVQSDSGQVNSASARSYALTFATNNVTRKLRVRVLESGLWSPYSSITVSVSYTPPPAPAVEVQPMADHVRVTVTPGSGTPAATSVAVYRRRIGAGDDGELAGTTGPTPAALSDYRVEHLVPYEYRGVASSASGTSTAGPWVS